MQKNRKSDLHHHRDTLKKKKTLKMEPNFVYKLKTFTNQEKNVDLQKYDRSEMIRNTFVKHFASNTEVIYSPNSKDYYLPPHLNCSSIFNNVFNAECRNWKIRTQSYKKYNYDQLYLSHEAKYESHPQNLRWKHAKSKIKYLLDEDKAIYQQFNRNSANVAPKMGKQQNEDFSQESV